MMRIEGMYRTWNHGPFKEEIKFLFKRWKDDRESGCDWYKLDACQKWDETNTLVLSVVLEWFLELKRRIKETEDDINTQWLALEYGCIPGETPESVRATIRVLKEHRQELRRLFFEARDLFNGKTTVPKADSLIENGTYTSPEEEFNLDTGIRLRGRDGQYNKVLLGIV